MDPLDAYRCANLVLQQHGPGAEAHCADRSAELASGGDTAGVQAWAAILSAASELKRTWPRAGEVMQ